LRFIFREYACPQGRKKKRIPKPFIVFGGYFQDSGRVCALAQEVVNQVQKLRKRRG
jgi:hypothetical protein